MPDEVPQNKKLRLIMMGTGPFAVPSFEALRLAGHSIPLVVTRPQPPVKSRKKAPDSPVRVWANEHQLDLDDPDSINDEPAVERMKLLAADLLVVCDYGQILKPAALGAASLGGINLHGSLLPAYRGAAPVQRALLSGDSVTGVSVIHMTPKLDGGPIIATRQTRIQDHETAGELEERLSTLGIDATLEAVDRLIAWDGHSDLGQRQDPANVTRAARLSKAEGEILWDQPARMIDCHVRGMQPWPIAYTFVSVQSKKELVRVAIKEVRIGDEVPPGTKPGTIVVEGGFKFASRDRFVEIIKLQPSGKREMAAQEFLRGHTFG
ncbi:Methionyl-tRNA formyltransferase [Planctomycetes bacterium CA13]|uniref:Methionyl-tRNA formyltransferase n=1 Tax=Novipirellula herctigrandis TaxID=2527986 RepID=A0A5C5YNE6_9BACT|nr:Methionyl-tRNA formyltransferase [Planctomycetes bacterium CA13]